MSENLEKELKISEELEAFRAEIIRLKVEEQSDGKTAHLQAIDVQGLGEEDRAMWELCTQCEQLGKMDDVALKAFLGYKRAVKPFTPSSAFSAFLSNKINRLVTRE